jgi:hypothetical protein
MGPERGTQVLALYCIYTPAAAAAAGADAAVLEALAGMLVNCRPVNGDGAVGGTGWPVLLCLTPLAVPCCQCCCLRLGCHLATVQVKHHQGSGAVVATCCPPVLL